MTDFIEVATATETREAAVALAEHLVGTRLAGSAQITGPVTSVFWHLGQQGTGEEWRLVLLTTADRYPELEATLLARHPWDNPQVTATSIVVGAASYLRWLSESIADRPAGPTPSV
ncbi:divalent-cation tolerance protein CutA [Plantactinospora sp. CA-294935]|uniref:divalent-cation tolerance protein CutA n=1 Tax=Plantactinospora sp. CA-294935 TaxID=3240012 RepID=UPI003D90B648